MTVRDARMARFERARELIEAGAYLVAGESVFVYSDAPGCAGHTVVGSQCSCPDATVGWAFRAGEMCKHELVAGAVLAARGIIARRPDVAKQIAEVA
jgi:hypothetical protein